MEARVYAEAGVAQPHESGSLKAFFCWQGGFEFAIEPSNTPGVVLVWRRGESMSWGRPTRMYDFEARDRYGYEPRRDTSG